MDAEDSRLVRVLHHVKSPRCSLPDSLLNAAFPFVIATWIELPLPILILAFHFVMQVQC